MKVKALPQTIHSSPPPLFFSYFYLHCVQANQSFPGTPWKKELFFFLIIIYTMENPVVILKVHFSPPQNLHLHTLHIAVALPSRCTFQTVAISFALLILPAFHMCFPSLLAHGSAHCHSRRLNGSPTHRNIRSLKPRRLLIYIKYATET